MEYTDPRTGKVTDTGEYKADLAQLGLSASDIEALSRLGYAENGVIVARNPNDLFRSVAQVMDVVQNRTVTPNSAAWYGGTGIQGVINATNQFSPINNIDSWTGLPNAPAPYDTAVSTYAGLQSYGAPNYVSPKDNYYQNPNDAAYKNYAQGKKMPDAVLREQGFVDPTTIGTSPQQHISGFYAGKYNAPQPPGYGVSLPDDYNISLNRDLSLVPELSYLEQVKDPRGLGMHPNMVGVAAEEVAPDTALDPNLAASAGLGLRGPAEPFTSFYDDISGTPQPYMGGIGALPGMALDAAKMAIPQGLYEMFSPPAAPAPAPPSTPPSVSPLGLGGPPAAPIDLETPTSMRGFAQAPVGPPGYTDQRMAQAMSMLPDNYVAQEAPYPAQPVEQSYIPDLPAQTLQQFVDEARQRIGAVPEAPAPPEMSIPMFGDERIYAAPEQITPGQMPAQAPETVGPYSDRDFFGTETLFGVEPKDFVRNVPGIGLTGTPSMPFPEFGPPPEAPYPAQPVEQTPLAPPAPGLGDMAMLNNFGMAQPPAVGLQPQAMLDNFAMAQPPAPAPAPLGSQNFNLPAPPVDESLRQVGQFAAPTTPFSMGSLSEAPPTAPAPPSPPDESLRTMVDAAKQRIGAPPSLDAYTAGNILARSPVPDIPAPPSFVDESILANTPVPGLPPAPDFATPLAPMALNGNLGMAQPPAPPSLGAMTLNPNLEMAQPPEAPPTPPAPPSPVDAAFQAAPQPIQSVPVTPGLPEGPPTTTQLSQAAQMLRDAAFSTPKAAAAPAPVSQQQALDDIVGAGQLAPVGAPPTSVPQAPAVGQSVVAAPSQVPGLSLPTAPAMPEMPEPVPATDLAAIAPAPIAQGLALTDDQVNNALKAAAATVAAAPVAAAQTPPATTVAAPPDFGDFQGLTPLSPPTPETPTPFSSAPKAPPEPAPSPQQPAPLNEPVGQLPGATTSPTVESPTVSPTGQFGTTFPGGPKAINLAGDFAPKSFGPDYAGPFGINMMGGIQRPELTAAVQQGAAALNGLTGPQGLGALFGGPPAPPDDLGAGSINLGLDTQMVDAGGSGTQPDMSGIAGALGGLLGGGDTGFTDFGGTDFGGGGGEMGYDGGDSNEGNYADLSDDDPDDHGW